MRIDREKSNAGIERKNRLIGPCMGHPCPPGGGPGFAHVADAVMAIGRASAGETSMSVYEAEDGDFCLCWKSQECGFVNPASDQFQPPPE